MRTSIFWNLKGPVTGLYKDCFTFTFTVYKKREIGKNIRK